MKVDDKMIMDIYNDIKNGQYLPSNEDIDKALEKIKNDYCQSLVFEWFGNNDCSIYFCDIDCPNEIFMVGNFDNIDINDEIFEYEMKALAIEKFVENEDF